MSLAARHAKPVAASRTGEKFIVARLPEPHPCTGELGLCAVVRLARGQILPLPRGEIARKHPEERVGSHGEGEKTEEAGLEDKAEHPQDQQENKELPVEKIHAVAPHHKSIQPIPHTRASVRFLLSLAKEKHMCIINA